MNGDAAVVQALLRCWIRETGVPRPTGGGPPGKGGGKNTGSTLRIALPVTGTSLSAPVRYWSAAGWHEFGPAVLPSGAPADATTVAALLAREVGGGDRGDLVGRVIDSVRRAGRYVASRSSGPEPPLSFLAAEQALIYGHPLHPTPKSREGLSEAEDAAYAPELRGSFRLHWFAAAPEIVRSGGPLPEGFSMPYGLRVPAHPWQAGELITRPAIRDLMEQGLLRDLGPMDEPWHATSSLRTVYRSEAPHMLKLSLGLCITNSAREHLPAELPRGEEICRLLDAGLGAAMRAAWPGFSILRDPAWIAVTADGWPTGLEAVIRDNPFGAGSRTVCMAGLVSPHPSQPSPLARLIGDIAARASRTASDVAAEWFARYLDAVIVPVLGLYGTYGLGVEAHQQNTLVTLDEEGWPEGGWYRDNQGYYISPEAPLLAMLPGVGEESEAINPDKVIVERLTYYVGVNNLLGLVGALGSQRLADEETLLRLARGHLERLANAGVLRDVLLQEPYLRCKANLLTRVEGLDELTAPVESQSVYVDIPNPMVS